MNRENSFRPLRIVLLSLGLLVGTPPVFGAAPLLECVGSRSVFRVWISEGRYRAELRNSATLQKIYYSSKITSRPIEGIVTLSRENDPRSIFQGSLKLIASEAHPECDQRGKPAFQFFVLTHLRGQLRPIEGERTFTGHFENACGLAPDINESFRCTVDSGRL